jgi:hypothetical protein
LNRSMEIRWTYSAHLLLKDFNRKGRYDSAKGAKKSYLSMKSVNAPTFA